MKKDKLITIRVNSQVRDKFNQWCSQQGLSVSEFLSNIIEDCASGDYDMSSNNKEKSNKIARQKLIALEAKFENMSSQLASLIPIPQEQGEQAPFYSDITEKVEVLEKQIEHLSRQGYSISSLIDNKLDKNQLDALVQSKLDSLFDLNSLYQRLDNIIDKKEVETLVRSLIDSTLDLNEVYQRLDNKLDTEQVEVLVETKIDSVLSLNKLLEKLDGKLDKEQLEVLVKSQVESILAESDLLKQIDSKLYNTIDKQEVQTLVNSILNEDSLLKVIDKIIDEKLKTVVSPTLDVAEGVDIHNQEDVSLTENEELSIDNLEAISSRENDNPDYNTQQVSPEMEVTREAEAEKSIAEAIDNVEDIDEQIYLIPPAFQELPLGVVKVTVLAKSLGIPHNRLGRIADAIAAGKQPKLDFFPELFDYVKFEYIKNEDIPNKTRIVWTKIK